MAMPQGRMPTPQGEALVAELRWVHDTIRRDLETVTWMAEEVGAGMPPQEALDTIQRLSTNGPLWHLRINCMRYCRFVHSHHRGETQWMFPALKRTNPALAPVVDKLNADHDRVSDQLDEVEAAADALFRGDTTANRERLAVALRSLATDLLAHLEYEEEQVFDTIRTWTHWPYMSQDLTP
ncbi:Hemerythrin HHE cation binding domain-containing protein [Sinosporangium album]|uniref:Hemerythrin HHE cation binding domain-containing protein n=1 Tax=Sinosporangium album TaxID=504805 RepID=A0A1G7U761_9ACTN|nr:hemerythrin domain-containing protein [Sinosporangium album]SDG43293.1 Hemerythrin HHE cation binding domain-containing protein [Sinosporangium album]